jgi:hypothetical protein
MSAAGPTILDVVDDPQVFGPAFRGGSWTAWRAFLASVFGLPMDEAMRAIYRECTGHSMAPSSPAREAWLIIGLWGGKSRIAALVAVFLACFRDHAGILAPGEVGTIMLLAADRRQARTLMRYIVGLLERAPMLAALVVQRTAESITLSNRITFEIHTASFRAVRGYTIVAAISDEIAFWRSDESANPDVEIMNAIRPAMSTVPGALLLCISPPYARRGALWDAYHKHFGREGDLVLVWQARTLTMNPLIDPDIIGTTYEADPIAADAEYGGQFRRDLEAFVSHEVVDAVLIPGRHELPPLPARTYVAFVDPAGGSGSDSMTLAVAHRENDRAVLDCLVERKPPFSPEAVVAEFADVLTRYGLSRVMGDRFAGAWPAEQFAKRRHQLRSVRQGQVRNLLSLPARAQLPPRGSPRRSPTRRPALGLGTAHELGRQGQRRSRSQCARRSHQQRRRRSVARGRRGTSPLAGWGPH